MLVSKRSAGVAPEDCAEVKKHASEGSILVLIPEARNRDISNPTKRTFFSKNTKNILHVFLYNNA